MYTGKLRKGDSVMTVEEFKQDVRDEYYKDGDGYGFPIRLNLYDPAIYIYPSEVDNIPKEATHIVWFNK